MLRNYENPKAEAWYREMLADPAKVPVRFVYDGVPYSGMTGLTLLDEQTLQIAAQQVTMDHQNAQIAVIMTQLDEQASALEEAYIVLGENQAKLQEAQSTLAGKEAQLIILQQELANKENALNAAVQVLNQQQAALNSKTDKIEDMVGMKAEIINANLTVRVRGPEAEISALTEAEISAIVDLSAAEAGTATYKAVIQIGEEFPNVGAMKTSSVTATVLPVEG